MIPYIIDIKRHSLEDGPGIRSTVFFKGCPLSCVFCHNPESQKQQQELILSENECVGCLNCINDCPCDAITFSNRILVNENICNHCGLCADACPGNGIRLSGKQYSPKKLTEILLRDKSYYFKSAGGVTFSGGECFLYPEYLKDISEILKRNNIHIAAQTSGHFDIQRCISLIRTIDILYYDIKIIDNDKHLIYTGISNHRILENFDFIMKEFSTKVIPGFPLIPGVTDTQQNIMDIIALFKKKRVKQFYVHPFNPSGVDKKKIQNVPDKQQLLHFMNAEDEQRIIADIKKLAHEV